MTRDTKGQTISSFEFLRDLSDISKRLLMPILKEVRFRKNDPVFFRGDAADSMYFVLHGAIEISIATEEGKKILLSIRSPGSSFGEIGDSRRRAKRTGKRRRHSRIATCGS